MASPLHFTSTGKRSRKGKEKVGEPILVEDDIATQQNLPSKRRKMTRGSVALNASQDVLGGSAAGPSNRREEEQYEGMADKIAKMIQLRDFYRSEARLADSASITKQESEQLVAAVMRFMLFRQRQKPDQPVRRGELTSLIQGNYKDKKGGNLGNHVIAQCQAKFASAFGLEMKEIELHSARAASKPSKGAEGAGAKAYVMRSLLPAELRGRFVQGDAPEPALAFALVVLSMVNLAGGSILKENLWKNLERLAVEQGETHPVLGKPEDQIEALLKKRYLVMQQEAGTGDPTKSYAVGENALDEIQPEDLKGFIDQVLAAPVEEEEEEEEEPAQAPGE